MTENSAYAKAFNALVRAGVDVRLNSASELYIHAKAVISDGNKAFVGSENLSYESLDMNRELGILLSADSNAKQLGYLPVTEEQMNVLINTFISDFSNASPWTPTTTTLKQTNTRRQNSGDFPMLCGKLP